MSVEMRDPWGAVKSEIEATAQDDSLSADVRIAKLKMWRDDLNDLLGRADTYVGDLELVREGRDPAYREQVLEAREDATIRRVMLDRGLATPDELDALGYISHDDLDKLDEEGLLDDWIATRIEEATLAGVEERLFDAAKHPRGAHGKFSDVLGRQITPKGRRGALPTLPRPRAAAGGGGFAVHDEDSFAAFRGKADEFGKHVEEHPKASIGSAAVLGGAKDTQDKFSYLRPARTASPSYAGPGAMERVYTAQRKVEVHDRIIDALLRQRRREKGQWVPDPRGAPIQVPAERKAMFLAGGTAAGKSTARAHPSVAVHVPHPSEAVYIDPDEIKAMLPEYAAILRTGDPSAASATHEESSDIAKRLLREASTRGLSIVMDGTGNSGQGKFAAKIREFDRLARTTGHVYPVSVSYFDVPVDVALTREAKRAQRTGRKVSEGTVRSIHSGVAANFAEVQALHAEGVVQHLAVHDTSADTPKLIAGGLA